jgi:hypothetical protein
MTNNNSRSSQNINWLQFLFGILLLLSFFLAWVSWDGIAVAGYQLPSGSFFKTSETKFGLVNPFPAFSFALYAFWLIPVLTIIIIAFTFLQKRTVLISYITGAMSLSMITVFILFTGTLIDLGVGKNVWAMLKISAWVHAIAAIGLILTAGPVKSHLPKLFWLLTGPVLAYGSYKLGEKYVMNETFKPTDQVKADYTLNAPDLIREFVINDTAANKKYHEKTIIVNGTSSAVELQADSTSTVRFADSTGSYAIFSLEKNQFDKVKKIKQGDTISLKGVCSGSIFSEILGTTAITFKRGTLNQQ